MMTARLIQYSVKFKPTNEIKLPHSHLEKPTRSMYLQYSCLCKSENVVERTDDGATLLILPQLPVPRVEGWQAGLVRTKSVPRTKWLLYETNFTISLLMSPVYLALWMIMH